MTQDFAQKLINLRKQDDKSGLPSTIFGSIATMGSALEPTASIRIGMWPALSEEAPEIALGLMSALALLLERWHGITVYRVFARLEGEPQNYSWNISQSQFDVESWQIDSLDDNVGLWGSLTAIAEGWELTLEVESDFIEADDPAAFSQTSASINGLVNWLPTAAASIADYLEVDISRPLVTGKYATDNQRDDQFVSDLLRDLFEWELGLMLALWGAEVDIPGIYSRLLNGEWRRQDDFAEWAVASTIARTMLPGYADFSASLPTINDIVEQLERHPLPGIVLGQALFDSGNGGEAATLLEEVVADHSENVDVWSTLANLYRRSGDQLKAVDTFQRAIEIEVMDVPLLISYAQLLPLMEGEGWEIEEFVFIDPDEVTENRMTREAIAAYDQVIRLSTGNPAPSLASQIQLLSDISQSEADFEQLWKAFRSLVSYDATGDYVRNVVDGFYNLEELESAFEIMEDAVEDSPSRVDLHINLAAIYLAAEESEYAVAELEEARKLTDDPQTHADIERLMLIATDPDFEVLMGEMNDKLNAGSPLNTDEIDYLEGVLEDAPQYIETYLMLSRAYVLQQDLPPAMEVLLDAEKLAPQDPDILSGLAQLLWQSGEYDVAYSYLRRGLKASPMHIPLLTLMGRFLFEDDDRSGARVYLARAEAIAPSHPALVSTRAYIAQLLTEDEDE